MLHATVIFGEDAVAEYNETGNIPSDQWIEDNGGVVDNIGFRTQAEYDAYLRGLNDSDGWDDYEVIEGEKTTEDCPFCNNWREFFKDKTTTVYCPDCGQVILN